MKALKRIVWTLLIVVVIFYILPAALLQVPAVQKKVAHTITGYLEEKIGTKVQIDRVDFRLFNQIILKELYMEDQAGDTLLIAKRVSAGFDLLPLFKQQFRFNAIQLYTFTCHLNKADADSPFNIQYIIEAFQSKKDTGPTAVDLQIKDLDLNNGNVSYRVKNKPSTPGIFNPNDICLSDISGKIRLKELTGTKLNVLIEHLGLTEQSGFQVKQLTFDLAVDSTELKIKRLDMELPHSALHCTDLTADYNAANLGDNWVEKLRFQAQIEPSVLLLKDASAFVPAFSNFRNALEISGKASGTLDDLRLSEWTVGNGNDLFLALDANLRQLNQAGRMYINGRIKESSYITSAGIRKMADNFSPEPVVLPEPLLRLGSVFLHGEITGNRNNLTTFVNFRTGVGNLRADVNFGRDKTNFLKGTIASSELNIKQLMDNNDFGIAQFEVKLNATFTGEKDVAGTVDAVVNQLDYKSYHYENIRFSGDFTANSFKGLLNADCPDGQLTADGLFLLKGRDSEFNFSAKASDLQLDKLNFTHKYNHPKLSFTTHANFKGDNPDNLMGSLSFSNVALSTDKGDFFMEQLAIDALQEENNKQLLITSDLLTGKVEGFYSLKILPVALKKTLSAYLPSLFPAEQQMPDNATADMRWNFTINNTEPLSAVLNLPAVIYEQSQISGEYNTLDDKFRLNAYFPKLNVGGSVIEKGSLDLNNGNGYAELKLHATQQQKKNNKLIIAADFKALNDSIYSSIQWNDNKDRKYTGEMNFTTQLSYLKGNNPLSAVLHIQPSEMIFNDSIWALSSTTVQYREGRLNIDHFKVNHNNQRIDIEGNVSNREEDMVWIYLDKVDLDYIFESLNIKALEFGGIATGYVTAKDIYKTRQLTTDLDVSDFAFNDVVFGNLTLHGRWDDEKQGVEMKGNIFKNDSTYVDVDGYIYPVKEEISILFDAHNTEAAFLRKYLNKIAQDVSGKVTGKLRLLGDLNDPTVEGNVWVNNGSFGIEFLNARYTFSDWVKLKPDEIAINNITLYDSFGNKAQASGYVRHKNFSDFHFSTYLSYENFLVYNATARTSPFFYGTAFGTGTATIKGTEEQVFIDASMYNNENTAITLNFMEQPDIVDYDFINFVNKDKATAQKTATEKPAMPAPAKPNSGTDIRMNFLINANNAATVDMIMDPVSGDKISGSGSGTMQVQYGTKTPMRVFGNYQIEKGKYNFSFQQAFVRNFEIEEGSSVNFKGDPFTADLNIKAAYTVSANLGDLDQQLSNYNLSVRNNIPVNCVLLLSGPLEHPVIRFDLELPGATSELERQVKSYIRTDDMMNRQIVYLLIMGRFYTSPEYARTDSRSSTDLSMLTSTLSSYISGLLGSLSKTVQVGTNFHQSYEEWGNSTEVELLLSSTLLNNRLVINGNFGYVDNPYLNEVTNNVPLVGDFDIEYKLTKEGGIRLKGFNHYNYRNYSLTPEMTQGVGILFRRDFNNLTDLLSRRKEFHVMDLQPIIPLDTIQVQDSIHH